MAANPTLVANSAMAAANRAMREAQALAGTDIVQINGRLDTLASSISAINNSITALTSRVSTLETASIAYQTQLNNHEQRIKALESK